MTNDSAIELIDNANKLERIFLKDQATNLLRERIIRGQIPSGSKLTERDTALLLGISRAPARDALLELEKEGLVVSKSDGRYVIELTERDIRELYAVRLNLEKMAVGLAAQNASAESRAALLALLEAMQQGVANHNYRTFVQTDVEMHRLIWVQSNNQHLVRILDSLVGPIYMFVSRHAEAYDWETTLSLHEEMVASVNSGDVAAAQKHIELHLENALNRSLRVNSSK